MTQNDVILLDQVIEGVKLTAPDELSEQQVFGFFTAEQTLKDFDLSNDEIIAGLTDGGGDGGIDGLYIFADENLIDEDFDTTKLPTGYSLDVFIMQDKQATGFAETAFDKLTVSLPVLLDLSADLDPVIYSPILIQRIEIFRNIVRQTARKFPKIYVHVVYSTKASTDQIDPRVLQRAQDLETLITSEVGTGSKATVTFQGARTLLASARREPSHTLELVFTSSASRVGENSYLALVPIKNYADFLSDESGRLKKVIFESNVRDFQGNTQVNKAIRDSLSSPESSENPDFWWLNNGITVLSSQVSIAGGKFIIKDPQIVNGLQTSVSIYNHFKNAPEDASDDRLVLIKIIESNDDEVRNSVIIATNSQTNLLPSAIRAADEMQRDIEQHFESNGYYYDRRKNHYKNQGKPADLIFAVPYLAQAILSIGFSEPDQARARPSTLISRNTDYERIFSNGTSMDGYLWMVKLQREVDKRIKQLAYSQEFKTNMRFHLSMLIGYRLVGDVVHNPAQLKSQFLREPDLDLLIPVLSEELNNQLQKFIADNKGFSIDRAAKSSEFVKYLIAQNAGIE